MHVTYICKVENVLSKNVMDKETGMSEMQIVVILHSTCYISHSVVILWLTWPK